MDVDLNEPPPDHDEDDTPFVAGQGAGAAPAGDGTAEADQTFDTSMGDGIPFLPGQRAPAASAGDGTAETGHTVDTGNGTGVTLSSEDSDGEDEVQSTPETLVPRKPFIGMKFDSWEEAQVHYNKYAKHVGFSIRVSSSRKSVLDNERDKQLFICNKAGKNSETEGKIPPVRLRNRTITKLYDCKAKMRVKRIGARWEVTQFVEEHTHEVIQRFALKKYLRSHKNIPKDEMDFIDLLRAVNLSAGRIMEIMSELYGGRKFVPYDTKKISNYTAKHNEVCRQTDILELLEYFEELKKEDPNFFYKFKLDEELRVENIFWVDGQAREVYKLYNDCISFDTTFMTNMYKMPCAPFIRINRYGQTIQLGCGFLRNEKIPNFVWLFETFLEAMGGLVPLNIITDQDAAMRSAILIVFFLTIHRNCRWHIMQKLQQEVGPFISKHEELRKEFNEIMDYSLSPVEFEARWADMLQRHGVADNSHFQDLYDIRDRFVPAYFMDIFFPFLQTTARSEEFNAVLKRYVNPHGSLLHFFKQYMKLQEKIEVAEDSYEFVGDDRTLRVWSEYPIEAQMLATYTLPIYKKFQLELRKITSYNVRLVAESTFEVTPILGSVFGYGKRAYIVTADLPQEIYKCQCCKFSRDGMVCCHVLKVMSYVGAVHTMPQHYILPRWCVPPPDVVIPQAQPQPPPDPAQKLSRKEQRLLRYGNLTNWFAELAVGAVASEKTKEIVEKHLRAMDAELKALKRSTSDAQKKKKKKQCEVEVDDSASGHGDADPNVEATSSTTAQRNKGARDPPITTTKGRPGEKRKKSGLHLKATKKVLCSVCGSNDHNSQNCPRKIATPGDRRAHLLFG